MVGRVGATVGGVGASHDPHVVLTELPNAVHEVRVCMSWTVHVWA